MAHPGDAEWTDYEVGAAIVPKTVAAIGIAARVQGMRRYYALLLDPDRALLVRELDGTTVLAEAPLERRDYATPHALSLRVSGSSLTGIVDGRTLLVADDGALTGGAVAPVCERGCLTCDAVRVGRLKHEHAAEHHEAAEQLGGSQHVAEHDEGERHGHDRLDGAEDRGGRRADAPEAGEEQAQRDDGADHGDARDPGPAGEREPAGAQLAEQRRAGGQADCRAGAHEGGEDQRAARGERSLR